jgi:general secretion pathway protein H
LKTGLNRNGFTLLEVMMVVFLTTLVLGLSAAVFSGKLPSQRLEATSREIMASFRHARSSAISDGKWQTVLINIDAKKFGIEGGRTREIPESVSVKVVDSINGEITEGGYRFVFSPVGVAEGGTVVLWTGNRTIAIDIDPVVGAVRSKVK